MIKTNRRNDKGITLIKFILVILVIILLVFLAYEIVFKDILGIMEEYNPIEAGMDFNGMGIDHSTILEGNNKQNRIETVQPVIDPNYSQMEQVSSQNSHYYYQQLDEYAKIIYQGLENNIVNMQSGTYQVGFGTKFNDLLNSQNGEEKLNIAFQSAWNAFTYDYVDVFYIDVTKLILTTQTTSIGSFSTHKVYLSNGDNTTYLDQGFKPTTLKSEIQSIKNLKGQIVSTLKGYSTYDQIRYLHDWLIDNLSYDITYSKPNTYSVYGALKSGVVVCEGYARTFKYLLDGLGIENVLVSGTATNSTGRTETHAWNYVKLDDKWYAIDLTWDDPVITGGGKLTKELRYKYFLRGTESFNINHKEDGYISDNSIKFKFPQIERKDYGNS